MRLSGCNRCTRRWARGFCGSDTDFFGITLVNFFCTDIPRDIFKRSHIHPLSSHGGDKQDDKVE